MSRRTAQKRTRKRCRTLRSLPQRVLKRPTELAKEAAMMDEGFMAEARADTMRKERRSVRSPAVRSQLSLFGGRHGKTVKNSSRSPRTKGRLSWTGIERKQGIDRSVFAAVSKYRCLRCGRGSKYVKMQGKCTGPKYFEKWKM